MMNMGVSVPLGGYASDTGSAQGRAWQAQWLTTSEKASNSGRATALWAAFCEAHARNVYLMPQVACLPHETDAPPLVYATWKPEGDLRSLAVLSARTANFAVLPKLNITLKARRLVGCAIVGDESPESVRAFVDAAAGIVQSSDCDCLMLQDAEASSPLRQALSEAPSRHAVICSSPIEPRVHRWIRFPDKPTDYWSKFSKKSRYNFRWRAKQLEHRIECVEKPKDVARFATQVSDFTMHTWQYKRLGFRIDARTKGQMWTELARLGAFRSYLMWHGDRIVAYAVGIQWKGVFRYEETGYDPAFAAKSPGQVLLYRLVEDLIARNTPELLDFGSGDNEYKRIYGNHETVSGPMLLARKSARTMLVLTGSRLRHVAAKHARGALSQLGALSRLRHLQRGHKVARGDEENV